MRWIRTCWDDIEGNSSPKVVLVLAKIAVSGVMVVVTTLVDTDEHGPDADLDADADIEEEEEEDANKQSSSVSLLPLSSSVYISE